MRQITWTLGVSFIKMPICCSAKSVAWRTSAFWISGGSGLRPELFYPSPLGEGRLLILIDAFTSSSKSLEGRTKLAKLDFLLRYPAHLERALAVRGSTEISVSHEE